MSTPFSPNQYGLVHEEPDPSNVVDGDFTLDSPLGTVKKLAASGYPPNVLKRSQNNGGDPGNLPPGTACSIQMGSKVIRLSGASIMSDGE